MINKLEPTKFLGIAYRGVKSAPNSEARAKIYKNNNIFFSEGDKFTFSENFRKIVKN